jgi:sulfur transfer protein SufE
VLGALRTSATPGIDRGDEFTIEARRIHVRADSELKLVSGLVQIALTATGHVETIARDITARASSVHKIIGRMLHLN